MPVWTRGDESAEIVSPFPQKLVVAALGYSGSTGPEGVTGEIVYFDSVDALRAAPDSAVKGKIVFIDHHMMPRPRTARATASSARRAGRARP